MTLTDWAVASVILGMYWYFSGLLVDFSKGIFGSSQEIEFAKPRSFRDLLFTVIEMVVIGFSEEFVWRSYLQTRFRDWLQSRWQAVFVVAVLFGAVHLYQGLTGVFVTMFLGLIVGGVFEWRRQIVPLALMHALLDFLLVMFQPD